MVGRCVSQPFGQGTAANGAGNGIVSEARGRKTRAAELSSSRLVVALVFVFLSVAAR